MSHTEVIAHRGVPREHRENTLPGFERAIALGADAIELDVHATSDGVLVVHHDPVVRPPDGVASRPIAELTLAALRRAGGGEAPIPTLAEVLEVVSGRVRVYVEVKAPDVEDAVVALLRDRTTWTAVHSFDHRVAARIHALLPRLSTGLLLVSRVLDPGALLRESGARHLWQAREMIDADLVRRVHDVGCRLIAWTVNDFTEWSRLRALEVDGLCTDVCGHLRAALEEGPVRP